MQSNRLVSIRNQNEIPEAFANLVHLQIQDGKIEAVELKVGDEFIRILKKDSYSPDLKILVPEALEKVTQYQVTGTILDMPVVSGLFPTKQAAEIFMQMKLDAACGDANLEVNEVHDFKQKEELIF